MTYTQTSGETLARDRRAGWLAIGAGGAVALALTAYGTFAGAGVNDGVREYLVVVAVIAVAVAGTAAAVWRALQRGEARIARVALVLGVLGALSTFVFYLGFPAVLAAGAAALALIGARREERWRAASVAALVLAALTLAMAGLWAVVG